MKARELTVKPCELSRIRSFVETHHYSKSVNGVKISQCFEITHEGRLVGGIVFGQLSTTAWKKFADSERKVLELRRLVLLDEAEKNSESRSISIALKWIRRNMPDVEVVVSYADPAHSHSGVIYRASNFEYLGTSARDKGFLDPETGKIYHSRALRTKYKGDYKPFVKRLRAKHEAGKLKPVELPGKHCFIYRLSKNSSVEPL